MMCDHGMVRLRPLDVGADRAQHRRRAAQLLRLVRKASMPVLQIDGSADSFHLALWRLGAFERDAFAEVWVDETTGQPVVRDPDTLGYFTVDLADPVGVPVPYTRPLRYLSLHGELFTVQ